MQKSIKGGPKHILNAFWRATVTGEGGVTATSSVTGVEEVKNGISGRSLRNSKAFTLLMPVSMHRRENA